MSYINNFKRNTRNEYTWTPKWIAASLLITIAVLAAIFAVIGVIALIVWIATIIPGTTLALLAVLAVIFASILAGS